MTMRSVTAPVFRRIIRCHRGMAAVEFALLLPLLALMMVATFDFGMAFVEGQRLETAAHAGTQRLLYDPITAADTNKVELQGLGEYYDRTVSDGERGALPVTAAARNFCGCPDGTEVSCGTTCGGGENAGIFVELTLVGTADMTLSYPFTGTSNITLNRTSVVRVE